MDRARQNHQQLAALTSHLARRRDAIMQAWRKAVDRDPDLTTGASLPRKQLDDHIPALLEDFGAKLFLAADERPSAHDDDHKDDAAAHGLQRWQQGYDLREVTREFGRLQLCVLEELERYAADHPDVDPSVMVSARRVWAEVCTEGVSESTAKYFHLQQIEAMGNVRDLEQALKQVETLERQRAELWQEAAHDLRGNLGVVVTATAGLSMQGVSQPLQENFLRALKRNVSSLHDLLEDVTDLARLQAGHERRQVKAFDAAVLLRELGERTTILAQDQGLYLNAEGPANLPVEGDAIKVQRIAQNLLLNAVKYTQEGGVTLSWGDSRQDDGERWMLSVRDTGPGFHAGPGAPISGALEAATEESRQSGEPARETTASALAREPQPDRRPVHQERGEGIGLSIVKRLCELLDATVEVESTPGEGTVFRVLFPRQYAGGTPPSQR